MRDWRLDILGVPGDGRNGIPPIREKRQLQQQGVGVSSLCPQNERSVYRSFMSFRFTVSKNTFFIRLMPSSVSLNT